MRSPAEIPSVARSPEPQILIACDDDTVAGQLQTILRAARIESVCTKSIVTACYFAQCGRFPVIFTLPSLSDGSWRQIIDVCKYSRPAPAVVVVARSFDINEWGESLTYGAFDVLDSLQEIPRAAEVASRAFSTLSPRSLDLPRAAARSAAMS